MELPLEMIQRALHLKRDALQVLRTLLISRIHQPCYGNFYASGCIQFTSACKRQQTLVGVKREHRDATAIGGFEQCGDIALRKLRDVDNFERHSRLIEWIYAFGYALSASYDGIDRLAAF